MDEAFLARVPGETARIAVDTGIIDNDSKWRCAVGEITPDYQDILFRKGFNGIMEDACGKKADGIDGTNAVSFMCLEAAKQIKSHQPSLSVRIHPDCPHGFMLKVCELVKEGTGFPAIHNDRIGTQMLANVGLSPKEATDWSKQLRLCRAPLQESQ